MREYRLFGIAKKVAFCCCNYVYTMSTLGIYTALVAHVHLRDISCIYSTSVAFHVCWNIERTLEFANTEKRAIH